MNPDEMGVDEGLIELLKGRDEASLQMFYERHSRLVYSLVLRILGSVSDAEEVTQEVFLKIWKNAWSFDRSKGSVLAWLMTVARRLAIDRTRSKLFKAYKSEVSLVAVNMDEARGDEKGDSASHLIKTEEARIVTKALSSLPEKHRQMIDLAYYEGLSHSKIALRLDMPLGTVKTILRKAVIDLRKMLDGKF
ncbi:sigma-70 family RNA polymerase sigma factor [candidate division TA06 bacterium]|nr:sigma-70 family RNA polymerase sigma factor [candidate division TA06 bacterium]